jgi:hypothetical protein
LGANGREQTAYKREERSRKRREEGMRQNRGKEKEYYRYWHRSICIIIVISAYKEDEVCILSNEMLKRK